MAKDVKIAIVGDAKSFISSLTGANAAAEGFGGKMASVGLIAGAAFAGLAVGVGAALFEIGSSFDDAYDNIRVKTGETGDSLSGLEDSFKDVVSAVPTDFGAASDAIASVNQKLDLTGDPLEHVSEQFLELSRITGTDLQSNLDAGTDALNNWGVTADQQPAKLDELFRASQQSGVSFADLATQIGDAGPVLRDVGLDFDSAAGLLATLGKAGLDTSDIMPALSKSLATAAKDGKPAADVFKDTFDAIRNAPDDTSAAGVAMDVFGAKAGPKLAGLVREGKLSYEDMVAAIQGGSDTILGAGQDTQDFAEKFEVLKNQVFVGLEPIATGLFNAIGDGMTAVTTAFNEGGFSQVFSMIGSNIADAWPGIQAALTDMAAQVGAWIQEQVPVIANQLVVWGAAFIEWVGPQIPPLLEKLGELLSAFGAWMLDVGLPLIVQKLTEWGVAFLQWVGPAIPPMLEALGGLLVEFYNWLYTTALPKIVSSLLDWAVAFAAWVATDAIPNLLAALPGLLSALADWIVNTAVPAIITKAAEMAVAVLQWVGDAIAAAPGKIGELIFAVVGKIGELPGQIVDALKDLASKLYNKALEWGQAIFDGVKDRVKDIPGMIADAVGVGSAGDTFGNFVDSGGKYSPPSQAGGPVKAGRSAMGTSFWPGGLTWVGERGKELVDLPRGSAVHTNKASLAMGSGVYIDMRGATVDHSAVPAIRNAAARAALTLQRARAN